MTKTGYRYKDVLFALAVSEKYNQRLGKLQLQKYIYLADILSPLWDLISSGGYLTYFHGPYNQAVQNAVDVLAFRGAVEIVESEYEEKDKVKIRYKISDIGLGIVNEIIKESILNRRYELFKLVGQYVNKNGWGTLRKMVYSEATYVASKGEGLGKPLEPDSMLTNESLQILYGFNDLVREGTQISKTNMISIFFKLLDTYQQTIKE